MITVKELTKRYGAHTAVDALSFTVDKGQIYGLLGPNGAGKTTIFNLLSHIYDYSEGRVTFLGRDITESDQVQVARMGLSRTFQNTRLFAGLSVLDNVKVGLDQAGRYNLFEAMFLLPRRQREERRIAEEASRCLEVLNLSQHSGARPATLPYGIQRRVEIARAIASRPRVLLLDEPAAGLNPEEVLALIDFIRLIKERFQLSILVIEHRMDLIMTLCDTIYVQDFGRTIAVGPPAKIQKDPAVLAAYLGEEEV